MHVMTCNAFLWWGGGVGMVDGGPALAQWTLQDKLETMHMHAGVQ